MVLKWDLFLLYGILYLCVHNTQRMFICGAMSLCQLHVHGFGGVLLNAAPWCVCVQFVMCVNPVKEEY